MERMAFAFPIKPGQFERVMQHQQDVISATEEHLPHADDIGVSVVRMYHQTKPIEAIVIYMEGDDIAHAIDAEKHAGKPASDLWTAFYGDVTGDTAPGVMPTVILDWHRDSGHAVGAS